MKTIVVTTKDDISIQEFPSPIYESMRPVLGGYLEIVSPMGLRDPYRMIVNDEGLLQKLPVNRIGSYLYGTPLHGNPIVGNCIFAKLGNTPQGPDIVGLTDLDAKRLSRFLKGLLKLCAGD